ncbi:formyltetrahydrofolate deformylase [Francisella tularensis subsp. novicida FSC159]|uniref:formyltetrahydrofolate deformylase n=1 Tax=Francisella tularensis TaxID=263 RepID=UPI0008F4F1CC|nr:formyltetrahydrofolate deformylase [Francisella tularensis]APA82682.1 Formyltetrahydrofolate deformylase [Francisella tularensis subsp. novicida PA10-7858]MBK2110803.1 formyltetrahydrofolate deformylase [Francisella tularensis subsp. novicida FSC159]
MQKYRLLIETDDQKGLVYKVSKIIFENNLNVERNSEFVDKQYNKFFMRTVFSGEVNIQQMLSDLTETLPTKSEIKLVDSSKKNIVILATKEMHCLGDLLIKHAEGKLDANITAVISNYDNLRGLVEKFDIPFEHVSHEGITREEHESRVCDIIKTYQHDVIVLAKYMRILSPNFVKQFQGKLLNIHHSFLPAFIGANPYKQAYERGVKIIGATSHFVTDDLDEGPIIAQDIIRVDHSYSWQAMRDAGHDVEKNVLSTALNLVLKDKVFVYNNKTVIL